MEIRAFRAESLEADAGDKLTGVLAPFNSETVIGRLDRGGWREEIAPGAFKKAIKEGDTVLLCDHDMSKPLARVSAGTLRLAETSKGLEFSADTAPTTYAKDLVINIRAGNKGGMSIGFDPIKDEWFDDEGKPATRMTGTRRILREVRLPEGSCVTNPAYKDTQVYARDASAALIEERAAKATYADLATCGACDATGQYGQFCGNCGEPMAATKPMGDYCTACGAPVDDSSRDAHQCEVRAAATSNKPYGDVAYADPKNGKYPIDKPHVKAAWAYINQAKNAAKYPLNGVTLASVKARIKAAMKKFGFTSGSAGEKNWEFYSAEWREDDPYLDDFYEIDAEDFDEGEIGEGSSTSAEDDRQRYANLAAKLVANLTGRSEDNIPTAIDLGENQGFCIFLRDDPDGDEISAIKEALTALKQNPPDYEYAISVLSGRLPRSEEPDTSTPDVEDDLALRMAMRSREIELETI